MNPATSAVSDTPAPFHPASSPDYVPREQLHGLQSHRLRQVVAQAYEHVSLYRQRMHKHGVTPAEIRGVEDVHKLPFTVNSDLRDTYPFGMFAVPIQQVVHLHPPSGVAGKPIVVASTRRDLEVWTEVIVRSLASCGIHRGDVIQNACGYNLFTDGLGLHYGAETLGATVIPISGGDTDHQIMVMKDFDVSAICCTPSYFLYLIERAVKIGIDLRELPLRAVALVAGPWSEAMRRRIEESAGIKAYDIYGLPEIIGPGVGAECCHQNGLHVLEDHFYPEIIDPKTGDLVPDGEEGELVVTTLSKEATPLIRYRTTDLAAMIAEPCPCGRTMRRIRRIGRRDDMFVIQGTSVFPSQIEAALLTVEGTLPQYQIVLTQEEGLDQFEVQIEVTPQVFSDQVSAIESLQSKLAREIEHTLGVRAPVRFVEPHTVERSGDKAKRVIDKRGV
ncbi:MAG: phenylacetate--CoA ligase family protein [Planctomycetota bacterium]|jgi:phenylacetate-CoA ligase